MPKKEVILAQAGAVAVEGGEKFLEELKKTRVELADLGFEVKRKEKELETISFRLERNEKAKDELKDIGDKLIKKSSLYSETGGNSWELVSETNDYNHLEILFHDAKKRKDEDYAKKLEEKMNKIAYETPHAGFHPSGARPGEAIIYVKGVSGEIGTENQIRLGDALEKSVLLHQEAVKNLKEGAAKDNQKIEELKKKITALEAGKQ